MNTPKQQPQKQATVNQKQQLAALNIRLSTIVIEAVQVRISGLSVSEKKKAMRKLYKEHAVLGTQFKQLLQEVYR